MSTSEPKPPAPSGGELGVPNVAAAVPVNTGGPQLSASLDPRIGRPELSAARSVLGLPSAQLMAAWANELFRAGGVHAPEPVSPSSASSEALRVFALPGDPAQAASASLPGLPLAGNALPSYPGGAASLPSAAFANIASALVAPQARHAQYDLAPHDTLPNLAPTRALPHQSEASAWHVPAGGPVAPSTQAHAPHTPQAPQARQPGGQSDYYFLERALAQQAARAHDSPKPTAANAGPTLTSAALPSSDVTPARPQVAHVTSPTEYEFPPLTLPNVFDHRQFDVAAIRRDFPILSEVVNGRRVVWLDNAATTQKPQAVIDRLAHFYAHENSNIHRAAHDLAARATDAYEDARDTVRRFINAPSPKDIIFVRGTTEAVNLVSQSWGRRNIQSGDEIIISWLEHHSNIVPWQLLCSETGARLRVAPVDDSGQVRLDEYERLFGPRTRLVSFTQVSNALGTVLPAQEMIEIAHRHGARVLVDGAQSVSHMRVDVQALDADFFAFSGHKVFGPTGIGVLYGKSEVLQHMPPWQGGGNMITDVTFDKTVYAPAPGRFEAGTGNIADAVGLGAALEYVERIGIENIARHEHDVLEYGTARLLTIPRLRLVGTAKEKAGVMGFVIDGVPTEQVGSALAKRGIAVRAGHHCAQPALRRFGYETTVRPSLALYNTREDVDTLIDALTDMQSAWPRF